MSSSVGKCWALLRIQRQETNTKKVPLIQKSTACLLGNSTRQYCPNTAPHAKFAEITKMEYHKGQEESDSVTSVSFLILCDTSSLFVA